MCKYVKKEGLFLQNKCKTLNPKTTRSPCNFVVYIKQVSEKKSPTIRLVVVHSKSIISIVALLIRIFEALTVCGLCVCLKKKMEVHISKASWV